MTHMHITIDDKVEFDGSVTEWKRKAPDTFKDQIKPGNRPPSWMKAVIMVAMADGVTAKQSMNIVATSSIPDDPKADGWTVKVVYR
jgi:hypothetical protein